MVLSKFGNSAPGVTVYSKVKEGFEKGLFELAIQRWDHIAHSQLTAEQLFGGDNLHNAKSSSPRT